MRPQKKSSHASSDLNGFVHNPDSRLRLSQYLLKPIEALFRTGDKTDTVDRLFASAHVQDLRLIVATAFVAVWIVFFIALISSVTVSVLDWEITKGTDAHQVIAQRVAAGGGTFVKIFGPTLALFGAILAWAYQKGSDRLGIVDLFACEIDTLCRIITVIGMVTHLVSSKSDEAIPRHFNSEENYFPILDGNSSDLQSLEASVVVNITAFYTFMKTVRDKFRDGANVQDDKQREELRKNLIYMLYLGLESGRKATRDLVEFEPACIERTMIVLISELTAYHFLRQQYQDKDDIHRYRLLLRGPTYTGLMSELDCQLAPYRKKFKNEVAESEMRRSPHGEAEWSRALVLWPDLKGRFDQLAKEFSMNCIAEMGQVLTQDSNGVQNMLATITTAPSPLDTPVVH